MQKHVVFELKGISISREKGGVTFRLDIPELTVSSGEFIGVTGSSGCGKSTFLDILGLILSIDHSERFRLSVKQENTVFRQEISLLSDKKLADIRREHIGYILQSGGLLPFLSVEENILLSDQLNNLTVTEESFYKLVSSLGIQGQINKKPQYLSGGQRQRVAIARALIHKPAIILADEPTASVDKPTAIEIRDQLKELAKAYGSSVLMVTHDTEMVKNDSDRLFTFEVNKISDALVVSKVIEL
ncbi:ABC transporter ATP-binding protein [Sulfurovum sp.]|uniref:ABC transporter ATP-binding protein n=1 Tax=Sulfurovum sp. TaxID=1969726 RepID=UPI0025FF9390|nr:ABC transporter ATP-binding protein [Sulfurovum sp.]